MHLKTKMLRAGFRLAAARRELSEDQFEFDRLYNVVSGKKPFGKVTSAMAELKSKKET